MPIKSILPKKKFLYPHFAIISKVSASSKGQLARNKIALERRTRWAIFSDCIIGKPKGVSEKPSDFAMSTNGCSIQTIKQASIAARIPVRLFMFLRTFSRHTSKPVSIKYILSNFIIKNEVHNIAYENNRYCGNYKCCWLRVVNCKHI